MDMTMETCRKFVEVLASDAPAPGGGGAAALVGAIGTALGNMVGSLTVGKKKYAEVEAEIIELKGKTEITIEEGTAWEEPGYTATDDAYFHKFITIDSHTLFLLTRKTPLLHKFISIF